MGSASPRSIFASAEAIPRDAIFEVTKRWAVDPDPKKINLGQGTYRDENGQPWILPSVRLAKAQLGEPGHEYLPIPGLPAFRQEVTQLIFSKTAALAEERVASIQSLSGTGALLLAGLALKRAKTPITTVYITTPTWQNQELLFGSMGFEIKELPYYNPKQRAFDSAAFLDALRGLDGPSSAIILHTCAHNPTGCDPSREQWEAIADVIQEKGIFPIFDSAYLGFNSGSVDEDAWAIRLFVEERRLEAAVCVSFAKNMGLYGERVGLSTFVTADFKSARVMESLLENAQRATVSVPPAYGARIATLVMSIPEIRTQWQKDLVTMSSRIKTMREKLYKELVRLQTPGDWSHIVKQSGMFGFTGLSRQQVQVLEAKHHVYMAETSRISIAGLNEHNVTYFAHAVDDVVRTVS